MIPQPNLPVQLLSIRWVSSCRSPWYFRIDILVTAASSRLDFDADHVEVVRAMRVLTDRYVSDDFIEGWSSPQTVLRMDNCNIWSRTASPGFRVVDINIFTFPILIVVILNHFAT
jgi:hypothetical protein